MRADLGPVRYGMLKQDLGEEHVVFTSAGLATITTLPLPLPLLRNKPHRLVFV